MLVHARRAQFWLFSILLAFVALAPGWAAADDRHGFRRPFDRIVVFGTSLSDPGNAFLLNGNVSVSAPTYGMTFPDDITLIPAAPYAIGGNRFSNGPTWIEQLAKPLGLSSSVRPALSPANPGATNFAVGGARASDTSNTVNFSLTMQVGTFLNAFRYAPSDALYVIEMGGNDIRDVPDEGSFAPLFNARDSIGRNIEWLYNAGARKFLVWKAPNLGLTPALRVLDGFTPPGQTLPSAFLEFASMTFNDLLDAELNRLAATLENVEITRFDAFTEMGNVVNRPQRYGLRDATHACISPFAPPAQCAHPDRFFFWDGIHPTRAGHGVIAFLAGKALIRAIALDH